MPHLTLHRVRLVLVISPDAEILFTTATLSRFCRLEMKVSSKGLLRCSQGIMRAGRSLGGYAARSSRFGKRKVNADSVIVTPNLSHSANGRASSEIQRLIAALLDLLTHHCDIVETDNER